MKTSLRKAMLLSGRKRVQLSGLSCSHWCPAPRHTYWDRCY